MTTFAEDGLLAVALDGVWQASLAAAVLVGVVLALQLVLGKRLAPRWRYALWLLVVARLLMPVSPASSFSLFNWVGWQPKRVDGPNAFAAQAAQGAGETPALRSPVLAPQAARDSRVTPSSPPIAPARLGVPSAPSWQNALAGGWLIGAAGYWLLVLVPHWRLAKSLKREKPISDTRFLSLFDGCKAALRLRMTVRAIETPRVSTPAVFGFVPPRVLLPKGMLNTWEEPALRHVILHELAHVRRRDVLLNWVLILAQGLHWFNPVVWFAFRRLRAERELVCDAIVLSHSSPEDRRAYGSTLIKLVQTFSQPVRVPSLTPILTRRNEIERRMTMIAQFQPSTRRAALALPALLVALVCLTFTRAAEKEQSTLPQTAASKTKPEQQNGSIRVLETELAKQQEEVKRKQRELDELKQKLQITELDAAAPSMMSVDSLRDLEKERILAASDYQRRRSSYQQLTNFTRIQLRAVLPTVSLDSLLNKLLEEAVIVDGKIAEASVSKGTAHPDVVGLQRRREKVAQQIDERVDGIMDGLKANVEGLRVRAEMLQAEMNEVKKRNVEESILRQPYYRAKRDLEQLQAVVEWLRARLWQEKVDAAPPAAKAR